MPYVLVLALLLLSPASWRTHRRTLLKMALSRPWLDECYTAVTTVPATQRRLPFASSPGAGSSGESSLGDTKSSLGDAKSSLGDAKSSLGDAESSLGDAESSLGDAKSSLGDAKSSLGAAKSSLGDAKGLAG
jgi:hypothetical protein